jgi:hypothetical protein
VTIVTRVEEDTMEGHEANERTVRAARNQAMFREVNERLEGLAETFRWVSEMSSFTCECADLGCTSPLELTLEEYEAVRGDGNSFVVLPGHVYYDVERVVRETERFVVVSKLGEGAGVAEAFDPRSAG